MADDSGIDPRYAAQFQRGYDPARHPVHEEVRGGPSRAEPPRLAGGPVRTAERVPEPPHLTERSTAVDARLPAARPEPAVEAVANDEVEEEPTRPVLIEWVLPAVGLVLLGAAAWFLGEGLTDTGLSGGTNYTAEDYAASMVRKTLPGPLLVAGMLAVTAWIVLWGSRERATRR